MFTELDQRSKEELMEVLESTTYALEMLLPYAKGLPLYKGACEDHKRALEVIKHD